MCKQWKQSPDHVVQCHCRQEILREFCEEPVTIEEFNFRYLIQRLLFRNMSPYAALFLQALIYMAYYSKYAIADHGAAYPFPFNLLLLTSVLGMGMVYGVITKFSKNFLPAATLHFVIWALFPLLAHYPGIATTLLPT